jgi:hypothetical protein
MTIETHLDNHPHAMIKNGRVIGNATFANCNDIATITLIRDVEWKADEAVPVCGGVHNPLDVVMHATWDGNSFTPPTEEYLISIGEVEPLSE